MTKMTNQVIQTLRQNISNLTDKDRTFALDLCASVERRGSASEKQFFWLEKLANSAVNGYAKRETAAIGDLTGITSLFDKARQRLKQPAIVLGIGDQEIRLSIAGPNARVPGSINVCANEGFGSDWFGRILKEGNFEASPRCSTPAGLVEGLRRFAADPVGVAKDHARLAGKCCFCNTALTDERSTAVGYGPTCAKNYGLPYPSKADMKKAA